MHLVSPFSLQVTVETILANNFLLLNALVLIRLTFYIDRICKAISLHSVIRPK